MHQHRQLLVKEACVYVCVCVGGGGRCAKRQAYPCLCCCNLVEWQAVVHVRGWAKYLCGAPHATLLIDVLPSLPLQLLLLLLLLLLLPLLFATQHIGEAVPYRGQRLGILGGEQKAVACSVPLTPPSSLLERLQRLRLWRQGTAGKPQQAYTC